MTLFLRRVSVGYNGGSQGRPWAQYIVLHHSDMSYHGVSNGNLIDYLLNSFFKLP